MTETDRERVSAASAETPLASTALRPSWSQVLIMFVCAVPVVAIAAGVATAILAFVTPATWVWFLLAVVLSPGWLLAWLIEPRISEGGWFDVLSTAFFFNFVYWFAWIFIVVLRSDRRWRRKHAARIAGG